MSACHEDFCCLCITVIEFILFFLVGYNDVGAVRCEICSSKLQNFIIRGCCLVLLKMFSNMTVTISSSGEKNAHYRKRIVKTG
jgi:hypothetical protein